MDPATHGRRRRRTTAARTRERSARIVGEWLARTRAPTRRWSRRSSGSSSPTRSAASRTRTCCRRPTRSRFSRSTPSSSSRWFSDGRCSPGALEGAARRTCSTGSGSTARASSPGPLRAEALAVVDRGCSRVRPSGSHPARCEEALALKAERGDEATVVAGGTFLGILVNQRLLEPPCLLEPCACPGPRRDRSAGRSSGSAPWPATGRSSARPRCGRAGPRSARPSRSSRARACATRRRSAACSPTPTTRPTHRRCSARSAPGSSLSERGRRAGDSRRGAHHRLLRDRRSRRTS